MAIKKAKILTAEQFDGLLQTVGAGKHGARDKVMLLLSYKCGLRACEIARLRWRDVTDARGNILPVKAPIELGHHITKGKKPDTTVLMHPALRDALQRLYRDRDPRLDDTLMYSAKRNVRVMGPNTIAVYLLRLYKKVGMAGCSSHSGRRTFITTLARICNAHGSSIKDVQDLARHSDIRSTEKYIERSTSAVSMAMVV